MAEMDTSEVGPSEFEPDASSGAAGALVDAGRRHGRGARSNASSRFDARTAVSFDDGWESGAELPPFKTEVREDAARTIICRNDSPDISFDRSINPYRGCEHGCIYCYARPSHAYLGHSSGLDFETKLYAKPNAAELLRAELGKPGYRPDTIALGANTDPYQPIEREHKITRGILEVLAECQHPVGIVTKSALVQRDIDILAPMAAKGITKVAVSLTTLDRKLARMMEPRAATPSRRLETISRLAEAGIPVTVMTAPIIPGLNDHEIEALLSAAQKAGARDAGYVLLRLPLEIKDLFAEWLAESQPLKAKRVMTLLKSMHGGAAYVAKFGHRQRGSGPFADLIARRFKAACDRFGLAEERLKLRSDLFVAPKENGAQLALF